MGIRLLDQEPGFGTASTSHPYEREYASHHLSVKLERQGSSTQSVGRRFLTDHFKGALVPDQDGSRAVHSLRDDSFIVPMFQVVIGHADGQPPPGGIEGGPLRHRPRFQDAADLQPEIPVKPFPMVFLHHEYTHAARSRGYLCLPARHSLMDVSDRGPAGRPAAAPTRSGTR